MPVLQRKELEESPLADLHSIAIELGVEGYRALRKKDLVNAIVEAQGGDGDSGEEPATAEETAAPDEPPPAADDDEPEVEAADEPSAEADVPEPEPEKEPEPEETAGGVLDILGNGSGFVRVDGAGQSRDDVYVSPAQIRRCELRSGDEVEGPVRPPRRNERHPSLVRVAKVNGRDAEPPEERPEFSDLTPVFPSEKLPLPAALDSVPFGKGARVAVGGPPGAGATQLLREIVKSLSGAGADVRVVLAGIRPEEVGEWRELGVTVSGGAFDASPEGQAQQAELAVERAKRAVERGGDAVVVVDTLEALPPGAARRVFGAARKVSEGGSLTVVAATGMAWEPQRWATTRVALDAPGDDGALKISASRSGTLRADLLG
jgi:transcription termination factor Rho